MLRRGHFIVDRLLPRVVCPLALLPSGKYIMLLAVICIYALRHPPLHFVVVVIVLSFSSDALLPHALRKRSHGKARAVYGFIFLQIVLEQKGKRREQRGTFICVMNPPFGEIQYRRLWTMCSASS